MPFEKFVHAGGSFAPKVSVRSNGQIGLSQGFLRRQGMDKDQWYIVLYYDRETRRIAIQATTNPEDDGAIKVIRRDTTTRDGKTSQSAQVSARSFLEYYDIPYRNGTHSYEAAWVDSEKMFVIDLNKPRDAKEDDA